MRRQIVFPPAFSRSALRRFAAVLVLLGIFAVGFGGSFTCEVNQDHDGKTRPDPPPR
jgi:hypothetical protein